MYGDKKDYLTEEEYDWVKGEIFTLRHKYSEMASMYDGCLDIRYDGCSSDGKTLKFRFGNLGSLADMWEKITKKEKGSPRSLKLGEFYSWGVIKTGGKKFGFTPLELIAKNGEADYILKCKLRLPKLEEKD